MSKLDRNAPAPLTYAAEEEFNPSFDAGWDAGVEYGEENIDKAVDNALDFGFDEGHYAGWCDAKEESEQEIAALKARIKVFQDILK